jgi:hypothetical protein
MSETVVFMANVESRRRLQTSIERAARGREAISGAQESALAQQRILLKEHFMQWEELRLTHMPGLASYLAGIGEPFSNTDNDTIENAVIWLPSTIPIAQRAVVCAPGLDQMESRLRAALLQDSLDKVRYVMRVKGRMVLFKNQNVRGQREGVRSRSVIDKVHDRAEAAAKKYRTCRKARLALDGEGSWCAIYQELRDSDVRPYSDPALLKPRPGRIGTNEDTRNGIAVVQSPHLFSLKPREESERTSRDGTGETYKVLSWIWTTSPINIHDGADDADVVLQVEWCKSRARCNRATEEVQKVKEEMRRTLKFLEWKADWWEKKGFERTGVLPDLAEGLLAYSKEQAGLQMRLHKSFSAMWGKPLVDSLEPQTSSSAKGLTDNEDGEDCDGEDDAYDSDEETEAEI